MIEIYGKPQCPFCDRAKALCEQKGLEYTYKSLGTDFGTPCAEKIIGLDLSFTSLNSSTKTAPIFLKLSTTCLL